MATNLLVPSYNPNSAFYFAENGLVGNAEAVGEFLEIIGWIKRYCSINA